MKHTVRYAAVLTAVIFILSAFTHIQAENKKPLAIVVKASGKAHLVRNGKDMKVKTNDLVMADDTIMTAANASVNIQFSSGVIFQIGGTNQPAEVKLDQFTNNEDGLKVRFKINKGSMASSTGKLSSNDEVIVVAPTAIAGVRGTEFIVDTNKDTTEVLVNEGAVSVTDINAQKEIMAGPGQKIVSDMKGIHQGIIDQFEKQRFEIFKAMEESKKANIEMLIKQKEKDRQLLEGMKSPFDH